MRAADCIAAWPLAGTRTDLGLDAGASAKRLRGRIRLAPTPVMPASRRKSRRVVGESVAWLDNELTASLDDEPVAWLDTGSLLGCSAACIRQYAPEDRLVSIAPQKIRNSRWFAAFDQARSPGYLSCGASKEKANIMDRNGGRMADAPQP